MEYKVFKEEIKIFGKEDFNPQHILECGQIFSYEKCKNANGQTVWTVYSWDKKAEILENEEGFENAEEVE